MPPKHEPIVGISPEKKTKAIMLETSNPTREPGTFGNSRV